jgi:formylmethanofuran dehydrogenase subunit B
MDAHHNNRVYIVSDKHVLLHFNENNLFISAMETAIKGKNKTISSKHILTALESVHFEEIIPGVREEYRGM